jgi:peroxiredoxin Q/BCP
MLRPGDPAPDFELKDGDGRTWKLSMLRGERLIIYFYPEDDTPSCTIQACDFRDAREDFARAGYMILGMSPQNAASHRAFAGKFGLNFPLLVDERSETARAFGAVRPQRGDDDAPPAVVRSTFVVDENGDIVEAIYGVKAKGHLQKLRDKLDVVA